MTADDRIKQIEKKVREVNARGELMSLPVGKTRPKTKKKQWSELRYTSIGYYLIVPLLGGTALGIVLDRWLNTRVFIVICIFLGALASFYNLWKLVKNIDNEF